VVGGGWPLDVVDIEGLVIYKGTEIVEPKIHSINHVEDTDEPCDEFIDDPYSEHAGQVYLTTKTMKDFKEAVGLSSTSVLASSDKSVVVVRLQYYCSTGITTIVFYAALIYIPCLCRCVARIYYSKHKTVVLKGLEELKSSVMKNGTKKSLVRFLPLQLEK
jgi:hypothetical protein